MAQLTETDVGAEVAKANAFYQPKDGRCMATPSQLRALLERLDEQTELVQEEANDNGIAEAVNVAQWASDMAAWQTRLQRYHDALDGIARSDDNTEAGCHAAYKFVTAPLLDGIYYERLPGIILDADELAMIASGTGHPTTDVTTPGHPGGHSRPGPPDVATPFMLGNQVLIYGAYQDEIWRLFWQDVIENAKKLAKDVASLIPSMAWIKWTLVGAGVLVLGAVAYGAYGRARGPRRNTKRRNKGEVRARPVHMKVYPARKNAR